MRPFTCSERAGCVEAEWFVQIEGSREALRARGCRDNPPSGSAIVILSSPPRELLAATETSCAEVIRRLDEKCRMFSGDDCPVDEGCYIDVQQVLDPDRGCATGEIYTKCRARTNIQLGRIEFLPCE